MKKISQAVLCRACHKNKPIYYCLSCEKLLFCEKCFHNDLHHDTPCDHCGNNVHEHWAH